MQIPKVGSGSLLRDGGHVKLICGQAFVTLSALPLLRLDPGYTM